MPKVTEDMIYIAWIKYSRGEIASPRKRMREALESVIETLPPTAESLGLWTHLGFPGWVAIPEHDKEFVRVWNKDVGYGETTFLAKTVVHETSNKSDEILFAKAYFDAHNAPLCKEHCLIGRCTLPEGHDGRHKRDVDQNTFYWDATVEA